MGAHVREHPYQRYFRSNVIMIIAVDRVGESKDLMIESESLWAFVLGLMIESLWAFDFGLMSYHPPGIEIPKLMFYSVPIFSSILFVITEAFHISYPDQTELVSYFLS